MLRQGLLAAQNKSVNAVEWTPDTDYLTIASPITSSSGKFTFSGWLKIDGESPSGPDAQILQSDIPGDSGKDLRLSYRGSSSEQMSWTAVDTNVPGQYSFFSNSNSITSDSDWHHILMSFDYNQSPGSRNGHMYIDDIDEAFASTNSGSAFTYWSISRLFLGHAPFASYGFNGSSAEIYITDEYLDLSVEANRRKFVLPSLRPADLGADGSTPTGTAALIYLNGNAANAGVNSGSGANFTINGSPTDSASNPWS